MRIMEVTVKGEDEKNLYIDIEKLNRDNWYVFESTQGKFLGYVTERELPSVYITDINYPKKLEYIEKDKCKFIRATVIKRLVIEV